MHLAETREQAIDDCAHGLADFANYFGGGAGFVPLAANIEDAPASPRALAEAYAESGQAVIGTPNDAIAYIERLLDQSGGFGTFLLLGHDWAPPDRTLASYRLFARQVMPHFQRHLAPARASHDWATAKRNEIFGRAGQAMLNAVTAHVDEKAADVASAPDSTPTSSPRPG